eukprot:9485572-Pyramimonas_sp.AAC.2
MVSRPMRSASSRMRRSVCRAAPSTPCSGSTLKSTWHSHIGSGSVPHSAALRYTRVYIRARLVQSLPWGHRVRGMREGCSKGQCKAYLTDGVAHEQQRAMAKAFVAGAHKVLLCVEHLRLQQLTHPFQVPAQSKARSKEVKHKCKS